MMNAQTYNVPVTMNNVVTVGSIMSMRRSMPHNGTKLTLVWDMKTFLPTDTYKISKWYQYVGKMPPLKTVYVNGALVMPTTYDYPEGTKFHYTDLPDRQYVVVAEGMYDSVIYCEIDDYDMGPGIRIDRARWDELWRESVFSLSVPKVVSIPTSCNSCPKVNEYNHPANNGIHWTCAECKIIKSMW